SSDCWYRIIQEALEVKSGTYRFSQGNHEQAPSFAEDKPHQEIPSLPVWAYMQPAEAGQEKSNLKKKKTRSNAAVERGILIHRFFEYLPQLPEGRRYEAACQMVKKEGLTQSEWEGDIEATLKM